MTSATPRSSTTLDPFKPIILKHPSAPNLEAHIIPYGLTVHRLLFTRSSRSGSRAEEVVHDLIVGPEKERDHRDLGRNFFGPIVGPFANRLPAGVSKFQYSRGKGDSETIEGFIDVSEWSGTGVCLHGGPEVAAGGKLQRGPFDRLVWKPVETGSDLQQSIFTAEELSTSPSSRSAQKLFRVDYEEIPIGKDSQPRGLRIEALYTLAPLTSSSTTLSQLLPSAKSVGSLNVEYRAVFLDTGEEQEGVGNKITPLNITQHWGFNLSASDPSSAVRKSDQGQIDAHQLRILMSQDQVRLMELQSNALPTGKLLSTVKEGNTSHDWTREGRDGMGKTITENMPEGGYDHFYTWPLSGRYEEPQVLLRSAASKLTLAFKTNQSGFQLYTANGQPAGPADAKVSGGQRKLLHRNVVTSSSDDAAQKSEDEGGNAHRSAAFIEFGHPHATFLHRELQDFIGNDEDTLLRVGDTYRNWVSVEIFEG